jgi:predicted TIM-barrel enzyme
LDESVALTGAIVAAAKSIREDVICLCHGGPIAMPEDADYIIQRVPGLSGFYGASSTERFPTEVAIQEQVETFKALRLPRTEGS